MSETINVNGKTMEWFSFGNGSRKMVIIPGLSLKSIMLFADGIKDGFSLFAEDYEVFVLEPPRELPDFYGIEERVNDYTAAFEELGIKDAFVYSVSMGAVLAMSLALKRPDLVGALMAGSTAACGSDKSDRITAEWIRLAEEEKTEELVLSFGRHVYSKNFFEAYKSAIIDAYRDVNADELKRVAILAGGIKHFDIRGKLKGIRVPMLVIGAEEDDVFGAEAAREIAETAGCEYYVYPGYGHAVYDEAPDYRKRVKDFFDKY